ncbi:MAG: hypothetical protein ACJ789_13525 [Thermomicrobiales bacterium]
MGAMDASSREGVSAIRFTVLGLFEDTLDMERALIALRRAKRSPAEISILLRDRDAESDTVTGGAVPRAVSGHTLDAVGAWLVGLVELVLRDGGTYLVAGPIGAAVAAPEPHHGSTDTGEAKRALADANGHPDHKLARTLVYFGFSEEEAHYLGHRLNAGDALVALTTLEPELLGSTRRLFAKNDAVHIGQTQTNEQVFRDVQRILRRPAKTTSEIVISDAVDPFLDYCQLENPPNWVSTICQGPIIDEDGAEIGVVDGLLGLPGDDWDDDRLRQDLRYAVVRFGRVLGIGRRRTAIPSDLINLERRPLGVQAPVALVHRAPAYDPDSPFSRREEEAIFAHFGAKPYWSTQSAKASPA